MELIGSSTIYCQHEAWSPIEIKFHWHEQHDRRRTRCPPHEYVVRSIRLNSIRIIGRFKSIDVLICQPIHSPPLKYFGFGFCLCMTVRPFIAIHRHWIVDWNWKSGRCQYVGPLQILTFGNATDVVLNWLEITGSLTSRFNRNGICTCKHTLCIVACLHRVGGNCFRLDKFK